MPQTLKRFALVAILFMLSAPFTNCGQYAANTSSSSASSASCVTANCVTPNTANMSLVPNIIDTTDQSLLINPLKTVYSISGDCNEGGYLGNAIVWELHNGSVILSHSTDPKATDPTVTTATYHCLTGRFLVSINTEAANQGSALLASTSGQYFVKIILTPVAWVTNGSIGVSATVPLSFSN